MRRHAPDADAGSDAGRPATRLMIVQFAGDYLEAHRRLEDTGTEIYYGHRYVLEQLERFAHAFGETAILCCLSPRVYDVRLPNSVTVIGAGAHPLWNGRAVTRIVRHYDPTHLIVLGPLPGVIRWGIRRGRRVMCLFADSFNTGRLRRFLRYGRLAALLNDHRVEWVANHGVNACESLGRIGVSRSKIVPWDWPYHRQPSDLSPKTGAGKGMPTLVFVGLIHRKKGLGDVLAAIAALKARGVRATLNVAGGGDIATFEAMAEKLGIGDEVSFLGLIPNGSVLQLMREATIVVVPSRHDYPEGLPLTIYEALCSRTPIVASDHPMFSRHLVHRESAMIFPAGDPLKLSEAIVELLTDDPLYGRLSSQAQLSWERLQVPVKWGDLLFRWVRDTGEDRGWIAGHSLAKP